MKAKTAKKTTAQAKPAVEAKPVLTFQRTACYGDCPAYAAQVFADGRVAYEGHLHVPVQGQKEFKLPTATLDELLRTAQAVDFARLQERYSTGATDMPSTLVGLQMPGGQLKTVTVEGDAPLELTNFIYYLRTVFDPLAGVGNK
jgi:hypothetical protein